MSHYLARFIEIVAVVVFSALILSVFLAVSDRFMFHIGFFWTEELARFLFVWLGFLTAAIMVHRRGHFAVPYFVDKLLGERSKQVLDIIISCMMLALMVVLVIYGVKLAEFAKLQISPALRIPMRYVYYSVPVSMLMIVFFWATQIYRSVMKLKGGNNN